MRIAICCNDTRGGVEPYVALAIGLKKAGHDVRAVAPSDLAPMFAEASVPCAPLAGSIEEVLRRSGGVAEKGTIAAMRMSAREMPARMAAWTKETLAACEGADVMTGGVGGMVVGLSVADKIGIPFVEAHLQPLGAETDAYPGVLLPNVPRWLGGWGRRMSHRLSELAVWGPFRGAMSRARKDVLGLTGRSTATDGQPILYGLSKHVVPMPEGAERARILTGYWTLPLADGWAPPADLAAFLARGGPVVSIGFGSMSAQRPEEVTALVLEAVRSAGVRAVLLRGWGGLTTIDGDDVFCADALPHEWLFSQVSAIVHHGGAGTTGASLRSGAPSIVVPFAMDQPFWGSRVEALGAGPAPIPRKKLTAKALAEAIARSVTDSAMRARAAEIGEKIRAEDGVAAAVQAFDRMANA